MIGTATVIRGNALHLPLPSSSVDLICTSPPYFGLRSYQDAGAHYQGQIGSEPTPAEFLDALIAATREMVRVLKPSGSIFINLGDKYAQNAGQYGMGHANGSIAASAHEYPTNQGKGLNYGGVRAKSLLGIPWRYAIRCIDQLGLILRAEIIWNKPNGLPESVTDRVRRSHETWFHFTKLPRYFAAVDEIREGYAEGTAARYSSGYGNNSRAASGNSSSGVLRSMATGDGGPTATNPLGKLPGSVWQIPTQPLEVPPELGVDHFAAYPMEWPRRIIQGWTPTGICVVCGEGRRPETEKSLEIRYHQSESRRGRGDLTEPYQNTRGLNAARPNGVTSATITGYTCACVKPMSDNDLKAQDWSRGSRKAGQGTVTPASPEPCQVHGIRRCTICLPPTRPAVVLDPFGGTGTTALVAKALGRTGITIDLSADYCRLAQWRCNNPQQLAQALQVEKPDIIPTGQLALFE